MVVIKHQMLNHKNVLSYRAEINDNAVLPMVRSMEAHVSVLGLSVQGNIIVTKHSYETEFLIPVDRRFDGNRHYDFKPEFKLLHALRVRQYGDFDGISASVDSLYNYISEHTLTPITAPYYVIKDTEREVVDILIGVSENVL